jgi:hypothetical protein
MTAGRPSKCTPQKTNKICESIITGLPPFTAAQLHGISKVTHHRWMARGKKEKKEGKKTKYTKYRKRVEAAKGLAATKIFGKILSSNDWKASRYVLTLIDKDYAEKEKRELEIKGHLSQDIVFNKKSQEEILKEEGYDSNSDE